MSLLSYMKNIWAVPQQNKMWVTTHTQFRGSTSNNICIVDILIYVLHYRYTSYQIYITILVNITCKKMTRRNENVIFTSHRQAHWSIQISFIRMFPWRLLSPDNFHHSSCTQIHMNWTLTENKVNVHMHTICMTLWSPKWKKNKYVNP